MKRSIYLAALAAACITAIGTASAMENDALAIGSAKIGLAQAVGAAELHTGGKASRAEFEKHKGQWVFDVEVVNGGKVMDVKVDPSTGKVVAVNDDPADRDDDHDKAD